MVGQNATSAPDQRPDGVCPTCGHAGEASSLHVDIDERSVVVDGEAIRVTPMQAKIADILARKVHRTVRRDALYQLVYGDRIDGGPEPKTLDVHIWRLRKALAHTRCRIVTIWGSGLKMKLLDSEGGSE